jgi:hypothetical protein
LAVLATYVGDEFLALYHCVRSLAVKEPFPDAWDNLILLFERVRLDFFPHLWLIIFILNTFTPTSIFYLGISYGVMILQNRSSHLRSLHGEADFDFLKPFERSNVQSELQSSDDFSNCNMLKAEHNCSVETDLWSLFIRTMSFFFLKSRYS